MTVQRAGDLPGVAELQLDDLACGIAVAGQADPVDRGRAGWCRRILTKLGAKGRVEIVREALRQGASP
jgi:hypothetical protein